MDRQDVQIQAPPRDLVLQTRPNWTAVVFFAGLSGLHLAVALPAFARYRWEGYMSMLLGGIFIALAVVSYLARCEIAILPGQKRIRLRSGLPRWHFQRFIPFTNVHGVRLTMYHPSARGESRIEVLCDSEDIECPATPIPRQQALCLAVLMGVRLIKILPDGVPGHSSPPRF
jgi:hypothetical protein